MNILENQFLLLAVTFGFYFLAKVLQQKTGLFFLNPILVGILLLIGFLKVGHVSYEVYHQSGGLIEFWLKPAVVALGVPLYLQLEMIKKQFWTLLFSQLAGCLVGVVSVVVIAHALGATREVVVSIAAKSVTTPIAMEVTKSLGGIPSLTAAVVICVGLLGAVIGYQVLRLFRVKSPMAQGLSMGTAAHSAGTAAAMDVSSKHGAFASLGLTLNGILTAILAPTILHWMGY